MKRLNRIFFLGLGLVLGAVIFGLPLLANAQGPTTTTFTYQGRLIRSGDYVDNIICNFQFGLYGTLLGGASLGGVQALNNVPVSDGYFTVNLDFGDQFNGDPRYLETAVQCPGDAGLTTLTPRVTLYAAPYAHSAARAPWTGITGMPAGFADGIDDGQAYTAGTGITIGSGNVISATFAGTGSAGTVARSDHNHDTIYLNANAAAGGDLTGAYPNPQITANAVGSAEIADNSVDMADTVNWMGHGNPVATFTNNTGPFDLLLWSSSPFTPTANGSCLVVASAIITATGPAAPVYNRVRLDIVVRRGGSGVAGDGDTQMIFTPDDFQTYRPISASANYVFPVAPNEQTEFGCRVSDPAGPDWDLGEIVSCRISYICQ